MRIEDFSLNEAKFEANETDKEMFESLKSGGSFSFTSTVDSETAEALWKLVHMDDEEDKKKLEKFCETLDCFHCPFGTDTFGCSLFKGDLTQNRVTAAKDVLQKMKKLDELFDELMEGIEIDEGEQNDDT